VYRRHRVLLWVLTAAWKRLPLDRELDINVITTTTLLVLPSLPVIARVHPAHLVNVDWAPGGCQPLDQASRLGLQYAKNWQLSSTSTIAIVIVTQPVSWYSFYISWRVEGWVDLGTAVKVHSPCPRLYIAAAVTINTTARGVIQTWFFSHRGQKH